MAKIIWMSDPHFQSSGTIDGLNPRVRLATAIEHVNTHHPDADFAILSGDLVGDDIEGDYTALQTYLGKSKVPIYPMMGNNDERGGMRRHLPLPVNVMPDFIQYTLDTPDGVIICLDTHKVGSDAGQFCQIRQRWLDDILSKTHDRHVYVFMHHPPFALGLPPQDDIMLEEGDAFLDLICSHNNVKHFFMGHVHRATSGSIRGIPFATLGSLAFQAPAPRPIWDWATFDAPKEAPQLGILHIADGNAVLQYMQFCEYDVGF